MQNRYQSNERFACTWTDQMNEVASCKAASTLRATLFNTNKHNVSILIKYS